MKRSRHHWHIVLDDQGKATPAAIEHDHPVNPGRRHAHYRAYDVLLAELRARGMPSAEATALAMRLDRTAYTTLDFGQPPLVNQRDEREELARLHPEVRRSLS